MNMDNLSIPKRHGIDRDKAMRIAKPLLFTIRNKQSAQPSDKQWQRMGQSLLIGDPIADELALWIQGNGGKGAYGQFEKALESGDFNNNELPTPLYNFLQEAINTPSWVDWQRINRGVQASAISGQTGMRVLRDFGLMAGYQASGINQTLVKTGALERGASRRVAETTKWWMDCTAEDGLKPQSEGFKTTLRVRLIHAIIRQRLLKKTDWDVDYWGLPINQLDMQATYLAFSVSFLLGQKIMGTILTKQESEDVMHLWRYIGWLMGVDESLLCNSEQEGRIALYQNVISQAMADDTSRQLGRSLMDQPLGRHYPNMHFLRGHWEKQVHLSIIRLFVGWRGMKDLGLPTWTLPWYPILFAPVNALWCAANRLMPNGSKRLVRLGREAQLQQLKTLFGDDRPDIIANEASQS